MLEQAKLLASDGQEGDNFGYSVSVSGDYCIVGAVYDDDNGDNSGSVYIFKSDGVNWLQQTKLLTLDGQEGDKFGNSVSISGDYCIVGAYYDDDNGSNSGSAYIFVRDGENWIQQAKLLASDGQLVDFFGYSVSISGDYCIVGSYGDDDNGSDSGSAYIFKRDSENWLQQAKLTASDGQAGDCFGHSVSISGDYCIVGAAYNDDDGDSSGSAYIFKRDGENWLQQAKLLASDGQEGDKFGYSVSICADYCIIGAYCDDDFGTDSGSAYIFKRDGENWIQQVKLLASNSLFGRSVSVSGDCCVVGSNSSPYIFKRDGETWLQQAKLLASDDQFLGHPVSISADYCITGAPWADDNGTNSGSAYIFMPPGNLVGLEITGPEQVLRYSYTQYQAIAHYDNGASEIVNEAADWFVEPNDYATIDANGLLLPYADDITIYAQYEDFEAYLPVSITWLAETVYVPGQYVTIQDAIDAVDDGFMILVAPGTYTGQGNRDIDFKGKAITLQSQTGPQNCIIDCGRNYRGFYFHNDEGRHSIIRGFTITKGYAAKGGGIYCYGASPTIENCIISSSYAGGGSGWGPGICCEAGSSPRISKCTIRDNWCYSGSAQGGGICVDSGSYTIIEDCDIINNQAKGYSVSGTGGAAFGGGIYCGIDGRVTINNCVIENNRALGGDGGGSSPLGGCSGGPALGGGIYLASNEKSSVRNCRITDNSIKYGKGLRVIIGTDGSDGPVFGGGLCLREYGKAEIINCLINSNDAVGGSVVCLGFNCYGGEACGGGLYAGEDTQLLVSNCTIADNTISTGDSEKFGAGVYVYGATSGAESFNNCIIWGNLGAQNLYGTDIDITYSDIGGGYSGTGNFSSDPLFVTGPEGDYYLSQTAAGQGTNSPCVNKGSEYAYPLRMNQATTRTDEVPDSSMVDVGYHYGSYYPLFILGDLNEDEDVDIFDIWLFCWDWLLKELPADVAPPDGDRIVNFLDWAVFADQWQVTHDIFDAADFTDQWLMTGGYNNLVGDIAPLPDGDGIVNFKDFGVLADSWLKEVLFP